MDIELYEKLLKELSKSNFRIRLFSLGLTAEAGLHPQFKDFVMLTKKYINKGFSPKHIAISTNLMSMNKKLVDFIVESRVIDMITCSIDGKDKKSSERLKWGIKYETVLKNLDYLLEKNKKDGHPIEITINNGNDDESETKSIDLELKKRFKRADKVVNFKFHEWNGTKIRIKKLVKNKKRGFCYFTFRMIILTVDGLIGKCCYDQNGNTTYGDFNKYSLQEIYNSKQRKIDLKNLHRKRRDLVKGCEKCNTI